MKFPAVTFRLFFSRCGEIKAKFILAREVLKIRFDLRNRAWASIRVRTIIFLIAHLLACKNSTMILLFLKNRFKMRFILKFKWKYGLQVFAKSYFRDRFTFTNERYNYRPNKLINASCKMHYDSIM